MKLSDQDKIQQQRLIGYANAGDFIILNEQLVEVLSALNVYVLSALFHKCIIKEYAQNYTDFGLDPHDDPFKQTVKEDSFVSWLVGLGNVRYATACEAGLIYKLNRYTTYPFYPSYKDVMWVVRVLHEHLNKLNPRDVYLLAVYRQTQIKNRDVEKTIISRDIPQIQSLIEKLDTAHEAHTVTFTHNREELQT